MWAIRRAALAAFQLAAVVGFILTVYLLVGAGGASLAGRRHPDFFLAVVATAVVAASFRRVASAAARFGRRLVYNAPHDPFEALVDVSRKLAASATADDALTELAEAVARATGAARGEVALSRDGTHVLIARWPPGVEEGEAAGAAVHPAWVSAPVVHRGQLLGTIRVTDSRQPVSDTRALLDTVASHAAVVMDSAALRAELRARIAEIEAVEQRVRESRRRIVQEQTRERVELERDIHDGTQQYLLALGMKLGLAEAVQAKDPAQAAALVREARELAGEARAVLGELANGLRPRGLEKGGLGTALANAAGRSPVPVELQIATMPRVDPVVEAAAYFTCVEALQNAAKHAGASRVIVQVFYDGGALVFQVADDGAGFDPRAVHRAGLDQLGDRLAALGGELEVSSTPGAGTTLQGWIPVMSPLGPRP